MRRPDSEDGLALITTLMVMVVLTLLVTATIAYAVAAQPLSRRDQDTAAALAAAQAGVDDYIYRLRTAEFEQYSSSRLPASPDDVPFRSTAWQTLPGTSNGARFHYDASLANGVITLTSTGRVRNVERTVQALIRRRSFLDYLYFTDYEVLDPASGFYRGDRANAAANCDRYWWAGRSAADCSMISFGGGDAINGPLHTNDTIRVSGAVTFNAAASTSMPTRSCTPARRWWSNAVTDVCSTVTPGPTWSRAGDPAYATIVGMPTTSGDLPDIAASSGCLLTGPSRITLKSSGLMDVVSDFTTDAAIRTRCVGTDKALPGVIHVRNVPTGQATTCPSSGNRLGYPISSDITRYECRTGDAFVSGTLKGRLTISAENDIVVVDHLRYSSYTSTTSVPTDMLGLIAEQFVEVYHPISCPSDYRYDDGSVRTCDSEVGTNLADSRIAGGGPFRDPVIHAAILSLNHSFIVQNYRNGAQLGTLTVFGAIGQKWRGPVALLGTTGYVKAYNYDARLAYEGPPSFIDPITQPWKVKAFAEVANPPDCTTTRTTACTPL